jgi:hypothetical protein
VRLGRIEKFLLVWALRNRASATMTFWPYWVSKSGAILSFARCELGLDLPKVVGCLSDHLEKRLYRNLHSSFSRALRRLHERGLIDYLADARELDNQPGVWVGLQKNYSRGPRRGVWGVARRRSAFRLTADGREIAGDLYRREERAE